ncbi:MAG: 3'-5' exonuclease [Aquificaceae bacterium]|nr:3'-5' exonuclease [Aquificaceae bacterium]
MMSLRRWLAKRLKPDLWKSFNWDIDKRESIEKGCFVVFDTETTGLDLRRDEPLSLGAVKIEGLRIDLSKSYYALLKPTIGYGESVKVHGITPLELEGARDRVEVCKDFLEYARGCILSGYFVHIDVAMVKKLVQRECKGIFYPPTLDLVSMIGKKEIIPTLAELLRDFNIPASNFHNALEDAYMSALLLLRFLKEGGYSKIGDLPLSF